jgi:hypothetical protein
MAANSAVRKAGLKELSSGNCLVVQKAVERVGRSELYSAGLMAVQWAGGKA